MPLDLVHLSRTNRALCILLASRELTLTWKAVRVKVAPAMPECPEDLSEMQYAELAFAKDCQVCETNTTLVLLAKATPQYCLRQKRRLSRHWYARRRICEQCILEQ